MIKFIGCSFTEGGGLDNIDYYNFITNANLYHNDNKHYTYNVFIKKALERFKVKNRFSTIVANKLKTDVKNLSVSRGSNSFILETLFNEINSNKNEIYVVIFSMFSRVYWNYNIDKKKYNLNSFDTNWPPYINNSEMQNLADTYKNYSEFIYNENIEKENIINQVKLLDSFSKSKNSKIYWSSWDDFDELKMATDNCITFDNSFLYKFVDKNELQIHHHTNYKVNDNHFSTIGNEVIADIIYNTIKNN